MISITNIRDGAVLHAHHGEESASALTIRAGSYGCDVFSAGGHEQYSFPTYFNYQPEPDHLQKLDETMRLMIEEAGCRPVFFQDGLLGNCIWEK